MNPSMEAAGKTSCFSRSGKGLPDPASVQLSIDPGQFRLGNLAAIGYNMRLLSGDPFMFSAEMTIAGFDPELAKAIAGERGRQEDHIEDRKSVV